MVVALSEFFLEHQLKGIQEFTQKKQLLAEHLFVYL